MPVLPPPDPECASCAARDERIGEQRELIGELQDALGVQAHQIAALKDQVARLERLISRNSGNSSMPPSADDQPGKKPPAPKQRRQQGRRPGKQKGAPGAHLAWDDHPDDTIPHFPHGACPCGADLSGAA